MMAKSSAVGYGRPPKAHRFKPGQSGNPRGRRKGTKNLKTDLADELKELIAIREGGQSKRISKQRAMLKSLTAKAIQGDARSATVLFGLMLRYLKIDDDVEAAVDLSAEDQAILNSFRERSRSSVKSTRKGARS